jgi:hypothetical protein
MENNVQVTDAYGIFLADISNIMLSLIVFFCLSFSSHVLCVVEFAMDELILN